ncbi:Auxin efflux carrier [Corchorus olitorius]|uniref:Auxin efflux carrier n=1 Tax=Corchorus olitorius TaxID=93759 RepID=A0A1R3ILH2_9ROSI|nr:Auxin efflux carrier [Corchorus olitorius]
MGFWTLFEVASMPILQVLLISMLGAFMATDYCKILSPDTRRSLNKLVFVAFTPSLIFANLAETVTLQDIISWWFMPVNIGITFLVGGIVGWIVIKILRPKPHLEGLIIATCSSGNLGNLLLIVVPAICNEDGSPFGNGNVCSTVGLSYASFSMALGGFYIWTITYQMMKTSAVKFKALEAAEQVVSKEANNKLDATAQTQLLIKAEQQQQVPLAVATTNKSIEDPENQLLGAELESSSPNTYQKEKASWVKVVHQILEELMAPPTLGAVTGNLGFLPPDPLFRYVLMLQFSLPPAMNIGTMAQLFDVGQEECSVLFLWTYLAAALALTAWSTVFMWILT